MTVTSGTPGAPGAADGAAATGRPIRVLVVDDSALVRKVLSCELSKHADIDVVGTAMDPYAARDKIAALRPDVLTLDLEMPRMDGLCFLSHLMKHYPMPVVVVSRAAAERSEVAARALQLGAAEVVPKPGSAYSTPEVHQTLVRAIRSAVTRSVRPLWSAPSAAVVPAGRGAGLGLGRGSEFRKDGAGQPFPAGGRVASVSGPRRVVAIGASTGGTRALEVILGALPPNAPGMVIVQHMPEQFTAAFAHRLDLHSAMHVREARDGDALVPGVALVARGGRHLVLERAGDGYAVRLHDGPEEHHQRPSVDVLFRSVAQTAGADAVGVLLTGMGADGASGLLEMRREGAYTLAQDERSSAVFGMPKAAQALGAAQEVAPLDEMARCILGAAGVLSPPPP